MMSWVCAAKGSSTAVSQSGFSSMSLSLIAFQPAIEEPSNMTPSARKSSVIVLMWCERCCHLPRGSVKRKSTYLTSCSLIIAMTFLIEAAGIVSFPALVGCEHNYRGRALPSLSRGRPRRGGTPPLDGVAAALAGADADRLVDRADEDLAVADAAGMRGVLDRLDGALDQRVLHDDLDLHLGQEIDDVFGAAIELGVALLPAEPLRLGDRDALDADLVQGFLHLVELERLDDGFDLFHCWTLHRWPISGACRQTGRFAFLSMVRATRQIAVLGIPLSRLTAQAQSLLNKWAISARFIGGDRKAGRCRGNGGCARPPRAVAAASLRRKSADSLPRMHRNWCPRSSPPPHRRGGEAAAPWRR